MRCPPGAACVARWRWTADRYEKTSMTAQGRIRGKMPRPARVDIDRAARIARTKGVRAAALAVGCHHSYLSRTLKKRGFVTKKQTVTNDRHVPLNESTAQEILVLGAVARGLVIRSQIAQYLNSVIAATTVYNTLRRLVNRGDLVEEKGEPPARGGSAPIIYLFP